MFTRDENGTLLCPECNKPMNPHPDKAAYTCPCDREVSETDILMEEVHDRCGLLK